MIKIRLLLATMTALVTTMAVLVTPAMAEFEATTNTTQGKVVKFPEKTVFQFAPGGSAFECKSATGEPWAEWAIQVKQQNKQGGQNQAKKGPHELLQIKKWGTCTEGALHLAINFKCYPQVEQGSQNGSTASIPAGGCSVLIGPEGGNHCLVKFAPQNNKELSAVKLENATSLQGAPQINIELNLSHITSTTEETGGECVTLGISPSTEGIIKTEGTPFVTAGQKLV